jgi:homoserine trans-succinylase
MRFMSPLQAISNIYGCDIMKDDIRELRERIYNLMPKEKMTIQEIKEVIRCLLNHFIYVKDALTYDFSFPKKASNENVELYYKNHNIKSEQSCIISENRIGNDSRNSTTIKK